MMNPDLKLTKMVTADEEGTGFVMPRNVAEKPREVERRRFYVCLRTRKHMDAWEVVQDTRCLHRREKRQDHVDMNSGRESERLWRESWREKPGGKYVRTESLRESESER